MIFGFLGKFWIYIGKILFKKSRKHMSNMSILFPRLKKNIEIFSYWKSQWKMKISLWSSGKNIENLSYEKVNEKWKFRKNYKRFSYKKVWVCLAVICDFAECPAIFRGTIRLLRSVDFCHEGSAISKILSDSLLWGVRTLMQMPSPGVNSPFRV